MRLALLILLTCCSTWVISQELKIVESYTQDELLQLIATNQHLTRVKADRCQLNNDIEANATVLKIPAYQFLWGDMLSWGVCVNSNPRLGLEFVNQAAEQGLPEAHEQLGRYYHKGILVPTNITKAIRHLSMSAGLGNTPALLQLADIYLAGKGSPVDFEDTYRMLCSVVSDDRQEIALISKKRRAFAKLLPKSVITAIDIATDE